MVLIYLLMAHHIGDVWAQPSWLIENKKSHTFAVFEHVMVYTGIVSLALFAFGLFAPWKLFFILVGHFLIDEIKYGRLPESWRSNYNLTYLDQLLHYLQIMVIYFY